MPTYLYRCDQGCGSFDVVKPIAARENKETCPRCQAELARVYTAPALIGATGERMGENMLKANGHWDGLVANRDWLNQPEQQQRIASGELVVNHVGPQELACNMPKTVH